MVIRLLGEIQKRNLKQEVLNETKLSMVPGNGHEQNPEIVFLLNKKNRGGTISEGRAGMKI